VHPEVFPGSGRHQQAVSARLLYLRTHSSSAPCSHIPLVLQDLVVIAMFTYNRSSRPPSIVMLTYAH
jgi:hypothetical protein